SLDLSPYYRNGTVYTSDSPFELVVDNLTQDKPTFVDFQVRPVITDHLWYAFNVLQWPTGDKQAQMQDVDGKTFYDVDDSRSRSPDDNGNVKVIPMLEIRMSSPPFNLPSESERKHYGITVQDLDDAGNSKAAYIPLQLVTQQRGGQHVAFSGRMLYRPGDQWGKAQQVRLVWAVQALVDVCDQYENGSCVHYETYNDERVLHTYNDDWQLTGLRVREEHGTDYAIVYEDPSVDQDLNDDSALIRLSYGLERTFLAGRDCEKWDGQGDDDPSNDKCIQSDGRRDVTIDEIARRFNHATNSGVTVTDTWHISDTLSVITHTYATMDEAVATLVTTDTQAVLDDHFTAYWSAGHPISPTLLFAREERSRSLNLDDHLAYTGTVAWSSDHRQVTLNVEPGAVKVQTMAGVNWAPYQYKDGQWKAYPIDDYWKLLKDRYQPAFADAYTDEAQPGELADVRGGAVVMGQIYYLTLYAGVNVVVQVGQDPLKTRYQLDDKPIGAKIAKGTSAAVLWMVNDILILENTFFSRTDVLKVFYRYMSGQKFFSSQGSTLKWLAGLPGSYKNMVTRLTSRAWLRAGIISLSAILALGVIYALLVVEKYYMADAGWAKGLVGSVAGVLLAYIFIYTPIVQVENLIRATMALSPNLTRAAAVKQVLTKSSEYMGAMRQIAIAGLVISLGITWGVFIWAMASGKVKRGSLEMDALIAQTLAAHMLTVIMFFLSFTVIGALIESVIMMVDLLLMILGVKWTVTYTLTFALTHYLFGFEMTIKDDDPNMIKMGDLDTRLVNPALGMSAGMQLEFKTTITSTVTNKDPKDPRAFAYLPTKYNEDDIRKNSLEYSLTSQATSLSTSLKDSDGRNPWDVNVDHRYAAHDMYNAVKYDNLSKVSTLDQPGVNRTAPLALNIGFAMYALECWTIPPWIPMCLDKAVSDSTSADLGANVVVDVFPRTLDEFMRVKNWASSIAIKDADGDGLMSRAYGGVDPDDGRWDGDGDGLSDAWEMQMGTLRADEGGASFDVRRADTDNDGLSDYDEARLGTNPANADGDGDGLTDAEEVAGWDFHYASGKVTRIYSDPLDPDADHDGMTDQFERTLHVACANEPAEKRDRCYRDNPYSPNVWNSNPIGVYTEVGDPDGIVRAGGNFVFTTTVQNNLKSADWLWVRGNTKLTLDTLTGYPLTMQYDVAKDKAQSLYSTLGVPANVGNKVVTLTTDVHSQLHAPSEWAWEKLLVNSRTLAETPLSLAVVPVKRWATAYAAVVQQGNRVMVYPATADGVMGDGVWAFGGANDSSQSDADMACNDAGKCLVVWAFKHGSNQYTRWRLFQPTAQPVGNGITLTMPAGHQAWLASVASDGTDFLVTWLQEDSANSYVRVANVKADGTQNGAILMLDSGDVGRASLAWTGDRYQAVWERANDIYMAYISGQSATSPQAVSATAANEFDPVLSYDALSDQTLVAYISRSGSAYSLRGRILAGTTTSDEFVLANPPQVPSWQVAVDDDPVNGGWVVAWSPNGARPIYYQAVGMDGGLRGRQQSIEPGGQTYQLNLAATAPRPAALFHFDEAAGITTFADSSGFNHPGGCRGTCPDAGQPGKQGQAVKFKGGYGDVEVKQANISNASYGVMFWFKADCQWVYDTNNTCGIYSVGDYWADNYYNHDRDIYLSKGNVCARLGQGDPNSTNSEVVCSSGLNFADGKWHHVAHTFGASVGGQHLYVDGELRASGKRTSSDLGVELRLRIGRAENVARVCNSSGYCGQVPYFQGWIDELALYPRALAAREV
ncbi:MAG: hypothetical protein M1546_20755, partial [Chloroflexi bacterium]|nr:hypothetical protein [Chloroflexota bacterium]